jgi:hypothetical protein
MLNFPIVRVLFRLTILCLPCPASQSSAVDLTPEHRLSQWPSTAIAGNDILSSCLYSIGACLADRKKTCRKQGPLPILFRPWPLLLFTLKSYGSLLEASPHPSMSSEGFSRASRVRIAAPHIMPSPGAIRSGGVDNSSPTRHF